MSVTEAQQPLYMNETTTVSSSPRVPLEIQDHTIQFLESGSKCAYSAVLVCHAWFPAATRRLYHILEFRDEEHMSRLADLALEYPRVRRHLGFTQIAIFHGPAYSARFPLFLSGLLTNLRTLCLGDLAAALDPGFLQEMSCTSVTRLELTEIRLPSSQGRLEQLTAALRCLKELDIDHLRTEPQDTRSPAFTAATEERLQGASVNVHRATMAFNVHRAQSPTPNTFLALWGTNTAPAVDVGSSQQRQRSLCIAFVRWVTSISSCLVVLSMELVRDVPPDCLWSPQREVDCGAHVEDMNRILRQAGPLLSSFSISDPVTALSRYDFSRNPNLTHIHVTLSCGRSWHAIADDLHVALRNMAVSMNDTACLSEIDISLKYKNNLGWLQEMPDHAPLIALHEVLESPAYSRLTRADIKYARLHRANWRSREAEEGADACFRTLLEPWWKRNVLVLTSIDLYEQWH